MPSAATSVRVSPALGVLVTVWLRTRPSADVVELVLPTADSVVECPSAATSRCRRPRESYVNVEVWLVSSVREVSSPPAPYPSWIALPSGLSTRAR